MKNDEQTEVTIEWIDAVRVNQHSDVTKPVVMQTKGVLVRDFGTCLLVRNESTIKKETGEAHPANQPVFYCIPPELILKKD